MNKREEVLATVNSVLPAIIANPSKYVPNTGDEFEPSYKIEDVVKVAFFISEAVLNELDKKC